MYCTPKKYDSLFILIPTDWMTHNISHGHNPRVYPKFIAVIIASIKYEPPSQSAQTDFGCPENRYNLIHKPDYILQA